MHNWNDAVARANGANPNPDRRVEKTDDEWKAQLNDQQYRVTRQAGTEAAFSSEMCSLFEPGVYRCVCCETELFNADNKFDSRCCVRRHLHDPGSQLRHPRKQRGNRPALPTEPELARTNRVCQTQSHAAAPPKPSQL